MTDESEMEQYGFRIASSKAEEIEEFRRREGMSKSEAIRHLVRDGLRMQNRRARFFERLLFSAIAIALTASATLLTSLFVLAGAGALGFVFDVSVGQIITAFAATALVALIGALFRILEVGARVDRAVTHLEDWLEVKL